MFVQHPIAPVFNQDSHILILGSFPSVKSRETAFFYGHPQNRFWRVLGLVYDEPACETIEDKIAFLLRHRLALWDVIASCDVTGSSDSSIKSVVPNDLSTILKTASIETICVNGRTAEKYYKKYSEKATGRTACLLPSTSPANASWSLERLAAKWREVLLNCKQQ